MRPDEHEKIVQRLLTTFDLFEAGCEMMLATLRRKNPHLGEEEIKKLFVQWLQHRPGAEHGDAPGVPGKWPRKRKGTGP